MDWKSAAFDSLWNWVLGGIILVISVITFFRPDLQPFLNFPALAEILPPLGWLALAFIIWLIGFAINVRKLLKQKSSKQTNRREVFGDGIAANTDNDSPIVNAEGSSIASGRDTHVTQNIYQDKSKLDQSTKPILRIRDYGNEIKNLYGINDVVVGYDTLYIDVFNKQKKGNAERVWSQIKWINENAIAEVSHRGRWHIATETMKNEKIRENLQYRDIDSNQAPQRLYFAWTPIDNKEKCFYGLERDMDGRDSWGNEKYKLAAREYIVKITLQGNNGVKQQFKYRIKNNNGKISITDALTNVSTKRK